MKKWRRSVSLFGVGIVIFAGALNFSLMRQGSGKETRMTLELNTGYIYDEGVRDILREQKEAGNALVLWSEEKGIPVTNAEFGRTYLFDAIALAGESSILFPGSNALFAAEEGCCVLGADVARKLFGSTQVNGKNVQIGGETYVVAGVEFERPEIVVYELAAGQRKTVEYAGIVYRDRKEQYEKLRVLQGWFGIW